MATGESIDRLLDPENNDRMKLYYFTDDIQQRLGNVIDARHVIFHEEMREPIRISFGDLSSNFDDLKQRLENQRDFNLDPDLENAGLTGNQLTMKLTGYVHARNVFVRKAGIKRLKRLLTWINSLLGSMALVPGISNVVEPIKELKEAMENVIEDTERS